MKRTGQRLLRFDRNLGARFVAGADEAGRGSPRGPARRRRRAARLRLAEGAQGAPARVSQRLEAVLRGAARALRRVPRARRRSRARDRPATSTATGCTSRTSPGCARCSRRCRRPTRASSTASSSGRPRRSTPRSIDGDEKSAAIAAASIVAKVTRDRLMHRLDASTLARIPRVAVGYIIAAASAVVRERGPTAVHRLSFQALCYGGQKTAA